MGRQIIAEGTREQRLAKLPQHVLGAANRRARRARLSMYGPVGDLAFARAVVLRLAAAADTRGVLLAARTRGCRADTRAQDAAVFHDNFNITQGIDDRVAPSRAMVVAEREAGELDDRVFRTPVALRVATHKEEIV